MEIWYYYYLVRKQYMKKKGYQQIRNKIIRDGTKLMKQNTPRNPEKF